MRTNESLTSFDAGEFSPLLDARTDVQRYRNGCRKLRNFLLMKHGGVKRRPGTQYIDEVKTSANKTRLIPFNFSDDTAYVLELGNQYMRFYKSGSQLSISAPSAWADGTDYVAGDQVNGFGGYYVCFKAHTAEALATVDVDDGAGDNQPGVGQDWADFWHTTNYSSSILEIPTPWSTAELFDVQFAQINDIMYLTHPDHEVQKLSRYGDSIWTLTDAVFAKPVFLDENITDITITPSATTGTGITLTASDDLFESSHVGSYWQIAHIRKQSEVSLRLNSGSAVQTSDSIEIVGGWEFETTSVGSNSFNGTVKIQRSTDAGSTWEDLYSYYGVVNRNVEFSDNQGPQRALFRIEFQPIVGAAYDGVAYIRPTDNKVYGLAKVTAYTSATSVTADIIDDLPVYPDWATATAYANWDAVTHNGENYVCKLAHTSSASDEPGVGGSWTTYWDKDMSTTYWNEGAWSDKRGFPRTVALYEERLLFAGTEWQPQTIWGSQLDDYENFRMGTNDDDAYAFTIAAQEFNQIQWITPSHSLGIGTSGGEWTLRSGDGSKTVTPSNVRVERESAYGSSAIAAKAVDNAVFFIQRTGRKVREQAYDFNLDARAANDATLLAEHVTSGGVTQLDFQQQPDTIIWATTGDGKLIGLTYDRSEAIVGWHLHTPGGTDAIYESVAVINGSGQDEVWVTVKRTINSATKRYVERLNPAEWSDLEDAFYVDSGITYDSTATTTITGLSHLEGETVKVFADGALQDDKTVSSGQITIDSASVVQVGLPYESKLKPMRLDHSATQGRQKHSREIRVRIHNSLGFDSYDGKVTRTESETSLFTGEKKVEIGGGYTTDPVVEISTSKPIPLTVLGIVVKMAITGR